MASSVSQGIYHDRHNVPEHELSSYIKLLSTEVETETKLNIFLDQIFTT